MDLTLGVGAMRDPDERPAKGDEQMIEETSGAQHVAQEAARIASEPANWLVASGIMASITTTHKAFATLAAVCIAAFGAGVFATTWASGLLRAPQALEAHIAADSVRWAEFDIRLDSLDTVSLRRSEGTREMLREVRIEMQEWQRSVDDLTCVLEAQARNQRPEVECRDPLPLIPRSPGEE